MGIHDAKVVGSGNPHPVFPGNLHKIRFERLSLSADFLEPRGDHDKVLDARLSAILRDRQRRGGRDAKHRDVNRFADLEDRTIGLITCDFGVFGVNRIHFALVAAGSYVVDHRVTDFAGGVRGSYHGDGTRMEQH